MARKKAHPTYDSKETATILGLFSFLIGLLFFLSVLTTGDESANLFANIKGLFGLSTIYTAYYFLVLGAYFFGAKWEITTRKSIITQFFLMFLIPAFLTSFSTTPRELSRLTGADVTGGQVGYIVVQDIFSDRFPTQPATKIILFFAVLVIAAIAYTTPFSQLFKFLNLLAQRFRFDQKEEKILKQKGKEMDEVPAKATKFGDFNQLIQQKNQQLQKPEDKKKVNVKDSNDSKPVKIPSKTEVEIKEGNLGEDGLKQETLKYPNWQLPPLSLLIPYKKEKSHEPAIDQNANVIEQILASFAIEAKVEEAYVGPSVIQYALNIPLGIKVAKIATLSENIALALGVDSKAVRIESIPDTTYLGIEVPRSKRDMVRFKELMESDEMETTKFALPVPIGKNINGNAVIADIQKMPHLLIAGATGSGKSVLTNSFISSVLMKKTPDEVKFILVDPKQVELSDYNGIPHLLTPVITDMDKVVNALKWAVNEMEKRYTNLAKEQVRNIEAFNQKKGFAAMPYIIIVIDEMADMMMTANRVEAEGAIVRLAQKARAVGIHLILATQRPSVNVITGIIKANIPGRVGMSVTSSTDSRVILDRIGAESLMGRGDLLYKAPDKPKSTRLQGANIEQQEVIRIVDFLKSQAPEVEYVNEIIEKHTLPGEESDGGDLGDFSKNGSLLEQAIRITVQHQKGSSSFLQRRLNIGFNKAAQLVEEMEAIGVVGPQNGSKPREVLISDADAFLASLKGGAE